MSLKIQELSTGNILRLTDSGSLVRVTFAGHGSWSPQINVTNERLGIYDEHRKLDDLEGVEITEALCEKLGFTTDGNHTLQGSGRYGKSFGDTHVELRPRDRYLRIRYFDDAWYTHLETDYCKYLHQLQNYLTMTKVTFDLCKLSDIEL